MNKAYDVIFLKVASYKKKIKKNQKAPLRNSGREFVFGRFELVNMENFRTLLCRIRKLIPVTSVQLFHKKYISTI